MPGRLPRHPLGADAPADEETPCTPAHRKLVAQCLELYLQDADWLADRVTAPRRRSTATVGLELAPGMVSRLELGTAWAALETDHPELARLLRWRYRDHLPVAEVGRRACCGRSELSRRLTAALDVLILRIWR